MSYPEALRVPGPTGGLELTDGAVDSRRSRDARRDRHLARLGYRVVRIPAEVVRSHVAETVARVMAALHGR